MEQSFHDLDPRGDVVFILELREDAYLSDEEQASEPVPEGALENVNVPNEEVFNLPEGVFDFPEEVFDLPEAVPDAVPEEAPDAPILEHAAEFDTPVSEEVPTSPRHNASPQEIRIRVSSTHLRLASTYFDKMFEEHWLEGNKLSTNDSVELPIQADQDPAALLILLNIVHGHTRKVPRSVSLRMLTKFAVLVDYYACHEALEVFSDMWIDRLKHNLPTTYSEDLIRWLCISWVFKKSALFNNVTRIAQRQSKGPVDTKGLPIPSSIIYKIDQGRQHSIYRIISGLHDLLKEFQDDNIRCSFECDSMMLGALTKQMKSQGLLLPRPEFPFSGLSFEAVVRSAHDLRSPNWHHIGTESPNWSQKGKSRKYSGMYNCQIETQVAPILESLEDYTQGLDLGNFPSGRERGV